MAVGGTALSGPSGSPVLKASTSRVFQAKTRSAAVSPGSPQSASIVGAVGSVPTVMSASAARTLSGIAGGRRASRRILPRPSTRVAMALASTVPGLRSRPPQLPEWWLPSRRSSSISKV